MSIHLSDSSVMSLKSSKKYVLNDQVVEYRVLIDYDEKPALISVNALMGC